jgi:hypothetical protein
LRIDDERLGSKMRIVACPGRTGPPRAASALPANGSSTTLIGHDIRYQSSAKPGSAHRMIPASRPSEGLAVFYLHYISPFVYLASLRIEDIGARRDLSVEPTLRVTQAAHEEQRWSVMHALFEAAWPATAASIDR